MKKDNSLKVLLGVSTLLTFIGITFFSGCSSNEVPKQVDCNLSDLVLSQGAVTNVTGCKSTDGQITVSATGGTSPYQFNINGGPYQTASNFTNLASGTYSVGVKDASECTRTLSVSVGAANSTLNGTAATTSDNQCLSDNGTVSITATGGTAPYQFQLGTGSFVSSNSFTGLKSGSYSFTIKDAADCQRVLAVTVPRGSTGISYANVIKPIIETKCTLTACHDTGTGSRDFTRFSNVQANAANIKSRTASKSMPPPGSGTLSQTEIDQIACWVDDGANNN